jgi:hypothetical protein
LIVFVRSALVGASLTDVTLIVMRFGVGSRSTPLLVVPPSSWTWKVKLEYGAPRSPAAGRNLRRPAAISPAATMAPAAIGVSLRRSVPVVGNVVTCTATTALAGESLVSLSGKSAVVKM